MSVGKRHKWTGSTISVMTGLSGASPLPAISGISKANPAVVTTSGSHGLSDADVVKITEVEGMEEVNDRLYAIDVLSANTFQLRGVDSSGYTTYTSGGYYDVASFSNFCEATQYNRNGGTSAEIDASSLCSDAKEYELDLPDFGTTQLNYNVSRGVTVQQALDDFYASGDPMAVKTKQPNNTRLDVQIGFVQQTTETVGNGTIWTGQATIRNTGAPQRFVV